MGERGVRGSNSESCMLYAVYTATRRARQDEARHDPERNHAGRPAGRVTGGAAELNDPLISKG